jgi:hypothetical protein
VGPTIGGDPVLGTFAPVTVDSVTVYPTGPSAAMASALYTAWYNGGNYSGALIGQYLDAVGWPAADRSIDAGTSLVAPQLAPTGSVLDMLRLVADSEFGALYTLPDGRIRFRERQAIIKAPYTTSQGSFGNVAPAHPVVIQDLKVDYARARVRNDVALSFHFQDHPTTPTQSHDAAVHHIDQDSIDAYGPGEFTRAVLTLGAGGDPTLGGVTLALDDLADWVIAHYKEPVREIRALGLHPHEGSSLAFWRHVLERVQEDRITHSHTAPGGEVIAGDYHIQKITHQIGQGGKTWNTKWALSVADTQAYWIWDSSTWDESTRWAA